MSFTVLTNGTTSLVVDDPPVIPERFAESGKAVSMTTGATGERFVLEFLATVEDPPLHLRFPLLTLPQAETLKTLLDTGGIITVNRYDGDTPFYAVFAPRDRHTFDPFIIDPHPERDRSGASLHTTLTRYTAEVVLIRL